MLKLAVSAALFFVPTCGSLDSKVQRVAEINSDFDRLVSALETELSFLARSASAGSLNSRAISTPVTPMGQLLFESRILACLSEKNEALCEEMGHAIENMARYSTKETIEELSDRFLEKIKAAGLPVKVSLLENLIPRLVKSRANALVAYDEVKVEVESARTYFYEKKAEFEKMKMRLNHMRNALWNLRAPYAASPRETLLSRWRSAYESNLREIVNSIMTCANGDIEYFNNQGNAWIKDLKTLGFSNPQIWYIAKNVYFEDIQRAGLRDEVKEAELAFGKTLIKIEYPSKLVRVTQTNLDNARTELTGVKMAIARAAKPQTRYIVSPFDI